MGQALKYICRFINKCCENAIYKVIRPSSIDDLGKNIVVQGGTFIMMQF